MTKDEALKMAIEWTEGWYGYSPSKDAVLKACKEALKQKEWQGLTNDMVRAIGEKCQEENRGILNWIDFYNAIEGMLKDKNNA